MIFQVIINGLIAGFLYALVALGFNLIYNATRIFHIAHGVVYSSVAYFFLLYSQIFGGFNNLFLQIIIILLSLFSAVFLGITSELLIYRKLRKSGSPLLIYFIASLGFYILIVNLIALLFGNGTQILSSGISSSFSFCTIILTKIQLIEIIVTPLILMAIVYMLKNTILGKVIRAMFDNQTLVQVLGFNVDKYRLIVIGLGSLLAAIASLLVAFDVGVDPQVGMTAFLTAAVAVIIGGVNSVYGTILGAIFLGVIQNLAVWFVSAQWQDTITFLILIIVLLIKKEGLVEIKLRLEEE
jgi:branched-chain amino acid transport system permease protein